MLPGNEVLSVCSVYGIEVRLSNYCKTIPYGEIYRRVKNSFEEGGVQIVEFKQTEWINFGFPEEKRRAKGTYAKLPWDVSLAS